MYWVKGVYMQLSVKDKVIVITGASRGLGSELARVFAKEGACVIINYHKSENNALQLIEDISKYNNKCMLIKADVTKTSDVEYFEEKVLEKYGRVDVLINNAGGCSDFLGTKMDYDTWKEVLDLNVDSVFLCSKYFSRNMIDRKKGKIINIASLKGIVGSHGQVNYSASKAAVIGFTKAYAKEMGEYNISVNAICPGFIRTDMNKDFPQKIDNAKKSSVLSIEYTLNDYVNFMMLMASDLVNGISGRVFCLDSRIL